MKSFIRSLFVGLLALVSFASAARGEEPSFRKHVAPILLNNCLACHGAKKAEGSYRVDTFQQTMKEGDSQAAPFTAGKLEESEAFRRIISTDPNERMPLEGDPLPPEQVEQIKAWIVAGAKYDGGDEAAPLASIVPPPEHPAPPEAYPHTLPITALEFGADGKELFVGGYHEVTVWNAESGELLRRIKNVPQRVYQIDLSPDGKTLAVAGGEPGRRGEVRLYDPATGSLASVLFGAGDVVFDVAFSPAGDRIAAASADGAIRVFDAAGAQQLVITSHSDWVLAIAWSDDGAKLASASRDKTSKVFDAKTGELTVTYNGHENTVQDVAFHADGAQVYSCGDDRKVHLWKIADGKKAADVTAFGGEVFKVGATPEWLFAASADKTAKQFNRGDRKELRKFGPHNDWILSLAAHPGAKRLATGSFDGEVRLWNLDDGKEVVKILAAPGYKK